MPVRSIGVWLAWLTVLLISGEWLFLLPLLGMGLPDAGLLFRVFWIAALVGWPVSAVAAALAANSMREHPRRAAALLVPAIAALAYPLPFLAPIPLVAASLAALSSRTPRTMP